MGNPKKNVGFRLAMLHRWSVAAGRFREASLIKGNLLIDQAGDFPTRSAEDAPFREMYRIDTNAHFGGDLDRCSSVEKNAVERLPSAWNEVPLDHLEHAARQEEVVLMVPKLVQIAGGIL